MSRRAPRSTSSYAVLLLVLVGLAAGGCDLVDETDPSPTAAQASPTARRYDGRTLLQVRPALAGETTSGGGRCEASTRVACGLDGTTSYALLGSATRVSLVNAKVVQAEDGTWGVQARFARESGPDLAAARERTGSSGAVLLLLATGNTVVLEVPRAMAGDDEDGRLVVTSGDTQADAVARIGSLTGG